MVAALAIVAMVAALAVVAIGVIGYGLSFFHQKEN
jgi:hypothetical protein